MSYIHCCRCSVAKLCPDLCNPMDSSKPGSVVLHYLLELPQIYVHWVTMLSNHLILCRPLLLLPSIFPSIRVFFQTQLFASGGQSIGASVSASDLTMNIQGWFPFDWFDRFAVQGTLKSILQHKSSKAWTLCCSAFFMVQLSHLYMITSKTIALTIWTFVSKVKSLSCVWLLATPWTAAYQAPLSMGFSKQEYWSRLPSPSPQNHCRWYEIKRP